MQKSVEIKSNSIEAKSEFVKIDKNEKIRKYYCEYCDVYINNSGNWCRHKKTQKHIKYMERDNRTCNFCKYVATDNEDINNHKNQCKRIKQNDEINRLKHIIELMEKDKKIELLQQQTQLLQQREHFLKDRIEELRDDINFSNYITETSLNVFK